MKVLLDSSSSFICYIQFHKSHCPFLQNVPWMRSFCCPTIHQFSQEQIKTTSYLAFPSPTFPLYDTKNDLQKAPLLSCHFHTKKSKGSLLMTKFF